MPAPEATFGRSQLLAEIAAAIPSADGDTGVRVGVDGPDGAGKTVFADELAAVVDVAGRPVVRVSLDDFHRPREHRHRRGRESPSGFWLDSFDYPVFLRDVLEPFGPAGDRVYRPAAHDLASDELLDVPARSAPPGCVLVVDGLFLQRAELAAHWDLSVFLDVSFAVTARRMAARDGTDPNPEHPTMRRYVEAQRRYYASCRPRERATALVDNTDFAAPQLRWNTAEQGARILGR